jgi:hypothetical protein
MNNTTVEKAFKNEKMTKLLLAVGFDLLGMATFIVPGLGEMADLAWAPLAALANFLMFRGVTGATGGLATFVEEIFPATDWIPSFTLTWGIKYVIQENKTLAEFVKRHKEKQAILAG